MLDLRVLNKVLILIIIFGIIVSCENKSNENKELYKRITRLERNANNIESEFIDKEFPEIYLKTITGKEVKIDFSKKNIVLIFSHNSGCQKCQIYEFENINKYIVGSRNDINVFGVYHGISQQEAIKYVKIFQPKFQIFYSDDPRLNNFLGSYIYPLSLEIIDGRINNALFTVLQDRRRSEDYWKKILN